MRVAIFTAVYGGHDTLAPAVTQIEHDVDFLVWGTDAPGWTRQPDAGIHENPRLTARSVKILSHRLADHYDYTIWIDGAHAIERRFTKWIIDQTDKWSVHKHAIRNTVRAEQEECIKRKQCEPCDLVTPYLQEGFIDNCLHVTSMMCRKSGDPQVKAVEDLWHHEVMTKSCRDQISLPYCLWKVGLTPSIIEGKHTDGPFHHHFGHRRTPEGMRA